jgi:hypothetical protein
MAENGTLSWPCVEALVACNRHGRPNVDQVIVSRDVRGTQPIGNCYGMLVDEENNPISSRESLPVSYR